MRNQDHPTLRVDELTLRPWRSSDVDALVAAYADPHIQQWHARSLTEAEASEHLATWVSQWQLETGAGWAITSEDTLVGRAAVHSISLADGGGEVAYWTVPAARGRGVATRGLRAVARWCLQDLGLHRLDLVHSSVNEASCRIAQRCGFAYEGTRRELNLHPDGWHDMHLHARLANDT